MLKKLLKYDLKPMYQYLIVFYIIVIVSAAIGRIFRIFDDTFLMYILAQIFAGTSTGFMVGALINNAMHIWELFRQDFYGDRSYLTHTLPVKTSTLFLSKFLTILITISTTLLVMIVGLLISYGSPETFQFIHEILQADARAPEIIINIIILICLEFIFVITTGLVAIVIGYRSNTHKLLKSICAGFGIYIGVMLCFMTIFLIWTQCDLRVETLLWNPQLFNMDGLIAVLKFGVCFYLTTIVLSYLSSTKLLKRGVNVD